jgi:AcrR family transcriptional regulator
MSVLARNDAPAAVRRPPYGANPALGRHGLRARREILDAARRLFAERGYHATTVEAIGEAAGRSGASVYQYFEGKGQIFGVFIDELTNEVVAQARRIGERERVRPGPDALPAVQARIAELSAVVIRHTTTFALWAVVEESEPALRGSARLFMTTFADAIRPVLNAAGVPVEQQEPLAIAMGAMVQSSHSTWAARAPRQAPSTLDEVLARVVCATLFPAANPEDPTGHGEPAAPARLPRPAGTHASDLGEVPGVRRRVTERSRGTLDRILSAAAVSFRRNGFNGTSINDIATEAGVSHASVYTYWPDRSALFTTLAHRAAVTVSDHIEKAPCTFATAEDGRAWLGSWLEVVAAHGAVLHVWTHEVVRDERLGAFAMQMQEYVGAFLGSIARSAPAAGRVDQGAAHVVIWSLLTDVPYTHCSQLRVTSHEDFLDVVAMLLMRGLLGYR